MFKSVVVYYFFHKNIVKRDKYVLLMRCDMKRNLLINTLNNNDLIAMNAVQVFKKKIENLEVINTDGTKINGCIGCTDCWIKTPGICLVNDDFNQIFMDFINSDSIILLTEGNVGFISHKMKNIIDRLLPLAVPYTRISKGTMRHISRYNKSWNIALVYEGSSDKEFLNEWMDRFTMNLHSKSLGAYTVDECDKLCNKINSIP